MGTESKREKQKWHRPQNGKKKKLMKAITVYPEWAIAIRYLGKNIENRSWRPAEDHLGTRIALHAGMKYGGAVYDYQKAGKYLERVFAIRHKTACIVPPGTIFATAVIHDVVRTSQSIWSVPGMFHWMLRDFWYPVAPIPCHGMPNFWSVPSHIARALK